MSGHRDQWFGNVTYAQHGDDLAILNIFNRLGIEKPSYLDVGAYHPFNLSNTALLYERGSRGINVEPNEQLFGAFLEHRPEDRNLCVGVGVESGMKAFHHVSGDPGRNSFDPIVADTLGIVRTILLPVITLNMIVDNYAAGKWPDLLTIDIEGLDETVLRSADFGQSPPRVIIAEADCGSKNISDELREIMDEKGFTLHSWAGSNMIYVQTEDLPSIL